MPFGKFKDWDDCILKMRKYYSKEVAEKVCGKLKAELEKDQLGSVGFGGVIDANTQIKQRFKGNKKKVNFYGNSGMINSPEQVDR